MKRRSFIAGTFALSACSPSLPALETSSVPLLPTLRLPANAPFKVWEQHLDVNRMRGSPNIIALSGGGEDGAFGAGVLTGWSETGNRPVFDVVTGVSTGALMASFAFLGPEFDPTLRRIYTSYGEDDILKSRGLPGLFSDALASADPMKALIERHLPEGVIRMVGIEWRNGRRLFVVTSNLDTGRAVIWDMGAIAAAKEFDLFRSVTLASASIPGLFPPVNLQVAGFQESHVDGGVHMQLLAVPEAAFASLSGVRRGGSLFILVNNTLAAAPTPVPRQTIPIMQQTFSTMVRAQAAQSVASARRYAKRTGMTFAMATIGQDFDVAWDPSERFSKNYMKPLFDYGRMRARSGAAWKIG